MFTGIIESLGKVESISQNASSLALAITCPFAAELTLGESVAVNGTCLTVTGHTTTSFTADVTPETFRRTSLGSLSSGSEVNLERAMQMNGRFGGHIVSGHIDGTATFVGAEKEENAVNVSFRAPLELGKFIVEKGSVAIDGISLTVAKIEYANDALFSVAVIPHTWQNTTLSRREEGSTVNIECDVVGKYISHFLEFDTIKKEARENAENDDLLDNFMSNFTSFH
ncbi:MAG: riboflavin synthase [Treponema sp.]|nr:riboflavin synthase [Treponema sp.]